MFSHAFATMLPGMSKPVDQESMRRAGAELRDICDQNPVLKHPLAQQHLQAWMDAQQNDASPEALCGKLAKTIVEIAALFQAQHEGLTDEQIEATLQSSIGLWSKRKG